ncbi:MAG: TIGR00299 family protein [Candidatus Rokubacteria bacterium 13_1_40CM_4_69_5]|nr:MAG: TIGR00299 family protein [Candidatus Rokubacteria bacterium 13_1_40CM_4_69_5]OLE36588.1 MAG: TIGR00299 family protein [Candidatus Rokubacteria bacterium 13_1_20CM_2_70_7]
MRAVYFDCSSGAAGDMIMAALVDAGAPLEALRTELGKLPLSGWRLVAREVRKGAFRATKVDVEVDDRAHHPHRSLGDILAILEGSTLAPAVKDPARRIFARLADAEARVHGTSREAVRFHDVGAVDAIIDVTGGVIGLGLLGVEAVYVSALPLGGGFAEGSHGKIPLPAPGTAELLRGFPVVDTGVQAELVTPTGAAILTTLAAGAGRMPTMTVTSVGYGAGTRDLDAPNVLRCFVGETGAAAGQETIAQVETTIDDMSPQLYEPLIERLFEAGALDVFLTPVVMKRSRPGVVVTALGLPDAVGALARVLFEESSTIGVRWSEWQRARLEREMVILPTAYGAIPFKVSRLEGRIVTVTPEFAEVARIAREKSLPVREVLDQARADARRHLQG